MVGCCPNENPPDIRADAGAVVGFPNIEETGFGSPALK